MHFSIYKDANVLLPSGPYEGFASSVTINTLDFESSFALQTPFGALNKTTTTGTPQVPVPITGYVVPITEALDKMYWKTV